MNAEGIALIKRFESLRLRSYPDPATGGAPWTIGWGHTGDVKPGDSITAHQADAILDVDLDKFERMVTEHITVTLNENQFGALVSFAFNVGPGKKDVKDGFVTLKNGNVPSIRRLTNAGDFKGAALQFRLWAKAAGVEMPGLVTRRNAERDLFVKAV